MINAPEGETHDDACLCDLNLGEVEPFPDMDLPAASGGVEREAISDGIDDLLSDGEIIGPGAYPTPDEDLPITSGGVAQ